MFDILNTSLEAADKIASDLSVIFKESLRPPPVLNLVEWADTYRKLPKNSAEPGDWHTDRVPPVRAPMMSVSNPDVQEVTVMCCIQLMKTELMLNTAMFYMHQEPAPMMYVAPKKELAEAWSKERLVKSVNATPVLKDIFADNRRGMGNTILQKEFPGGQISIVSARNPDDLAMRACMIMMFDEVDKYPRNVGSGEAGSGGEGDPIAVAWGRATTYGRRAKKIVACSPTVQGKSRVESEYLASNQGVYYQQCPHCKHSKEMFWDDVIIPVDEDTGEMKALDAYILCSNCDTPWTEGDRLASIDNGHWHIKYPEITYHHGYKVSSLASPFTPVVTLAVEFMKAKGNNQLLKAFYNTRLARTWREVGEQPDWERLYERRESYKIGVIPEGASMLTMGIDVQKDGIWYELVAWGRKRVNWSIAQGYIAGDVENEEFRTELHRFFDNQYETTKGIKIPVEKICIDSGHKTQAVYALVRTYGSQRVVAVKGEKEANLTTILGTPTPVDVNIDGKRLSRGLQLWKVGSATAKDQFYSWLNLTRPTDEQIKAGRTYPSGYCHFPEYDEEYFKQITAEQKVLSENKKGFEVYAWEKTRKDNHLLDCRVYARAGAAMLQIDRMTDDDWELRESYLNPEVDVKPETNDTKHVQSIKNAAKPKKSWLKRY